MIPSLSGRQVAIAAIVGTGLLLSMQQQISDAPITGDAVAIVVPAVNLAQHGIFSLDMEPPLAPTMYREPVPVFTTAAAIKLIEAVAGTAPAQEYLEGQRSRYLKYQNLFWLALLCIATFGATRYLTKSFPLALAMMTLGYLVFLYPAWREASMNNLYSEIGAAALMTLASLAFAAGIVKPRRRTWLIAGMLFGLLALTKAIALLVVPALAVVLLGSRRLRERFGALPKAAADAGLFLLAFALVISPWIARNWLHFQSLSVSERGGSVLYIRALINDVDAVEYRGLFYVWAPRPIRGWLAPLLNFSPLDLQPGGSLHRLNGGTESPYAVHDLAAERAGRPDLALTLIAQARAERVRLRGELRAAGAGIRTNVQADEILRDHALRKMTNAPLAALKVSAATLWHGGVLVTPLCLIALVAGWRQSRYDIVAFCVPALAVVLLYACFSVFEPRYGTPMTPLAFVGLAAAACQQLSLARTAAARSVPTGEVSGRAKSRAS